MKKDRIVKIIIATAVVVAAVSLTACQNKTTTSTTSTTSTTTSSAVASEVESTESSETESIHKVVGEETDEDTTVARTTAVVSDSLIDEVAKTLKDKTLKQGDKCDFSKISVSDTDKEGFEKLVKIIGICLNSTDEEISNKILTCNLYETKITVTYDDNEILLKQHTVTIPSVS